MKIASVCSNENSLDVQQDDPQRAQCAVQVYEPGQVGLFEYGAQEVRAGEADKDDSADGESDVACERRAGCWCVHVASVWPSERTGN